jgi:hypothetical protein
MFVVIFAVAGVAYLVASHADNLTSVKWQYLGKVSVHQKNEIVSVYACKTTPSPNVWQVRGRFTLTNTYKKSRSFAWNAYIINDSTAPIKASIRKVIPSSASPSVVVYMNVNNKVTNSLSFDYSAGTSKDKGANAVYGNIVQYIYPRYLPHC